MTNASFKSLTAVEITLCFFSTQQLKAAPGSISWHFLSAYNADQKILFLSIMCLCNYSEISLADFKTFPQCKTLNQIYTVKQDTVM